MKKEKFIKVLNYYSKILSTKAPDFSDPAPLHFWWTKFGALDEDEIVKAFEKAMATRHFFPSPKDFLELLGKGKVKPEEAGREASARILAAVSLHGWPNPDKAEAYIGPLGWEVVRMQGGWAQVCDTLTTSNSGQYQAQWRDLAITLARKDDLGLSLPPGMKNKPRSLPLPISTAINLASKGVARIED